MGEERVVRAGRLRPLTSVVTVVSKVVSSVLWRQRENKLYISLSPCMTQGKLILISEVFSNP